jgi:hypothetical protein
MRRRLRPGDGGHRVPDNARLAHIRCNDLDFKWSELPEEQRPAAVERWRRKYIPFVGKSLGSVAAIPIPRVAYPRIAAGAVPDNQEMAMAAHPNENIQKALAAQLQALGVIRN